MRGTARGGGDLAGPHLGPCAARRWCPPLLLGSESHDDDDEKTSEVEGPSSEVYSICAGGDGDGGAQPRSASGGVGASTSLGSRVDLTGLAAAASKQASKQAAARAKWVKIRNPSWCFRFG